LLKQTGIKQGLHVIECNTHTHVQDGVAIHTVKAHRGVRV